MEHTKGEWTVREVEEGSDLIRFLKAPDEVRIMSEDGIMCIAVMGKDWACGDAEANAERIVKAVNCHDELVEALKACRWLINNRNLHGGINWEQALADINVALAKAEAL